MNLRSIRHQRKWTQAKLAAEAQTSITTVSLIENGRLLASARQAHRIAAALDIGLDECAELTKALAHDAKRKGLRDGC